MNAYVIQHIHTNRKYLLKVLDDYISITIDGVEYRSFMSLENIHVYPPETKEFNYLLFKKAIYSATVQKNKTIGYILVVGVDGYSMYLRLFTMKELESVESTC